MTRLRWAKAFELGVPEIDTDHKRLLSAMRDLEDAVSVGDPGRFAARVAETIDLSEAHFKREEALLAQLDYPDREGHVAYPAKLFLNAKQAQRDFEGSTTADDMKACLDKMIKFLLDDIVKGDMEFKSFLEVKGVVARSTDDLA
jgi:hemerythrin